MSDPDDASLNALAARIDSLEARLTFQDDTVDTLNKTVTEQWARIDILTHQLAKLGERLAEAEMQWPRAANEPPPHY